MGWMQKCYETYQNNIHMMGKIESGKSTLCPAYHIVMKAQIEISISAEGEFRAASAIAKGDDETVIPVTEASGSRSSGVAAHMLCDQIKYIAMGNEIYPEHEKYSKYYEDYIHNLEEWIKSDPDNAKLKAIFSYCQNGTIIPDLKESGVIDTDENGMLGEGKIAGQSYEKCLVRWRVLGIDECDQVWLDPKLFESFINYYDNSSSLDTELCYISGRVSVPARIHPKGIVKSNNGAKLISANDSSGFSYRGRFENSDEALTVSAEVSQKAHSALRWLAANQGKTYGGRTYICWNPKGKAVPPVSFSPYGNAVEETPDFALTEPAYRDKIAKALNGYRQDFSQADDIVIISLDAATTGRLSVTYYNELKASDFLDRIENWNSSCCWAFMRKDDKGKLVRAIMSPSAIMILNAAYGTDQGGMVKADDKVVEDQYQRIFRCISDAQSLPQDIVHSAVMKASKPTAYSSVSSWNTVLSTACALVRKYYNDKFGKEVYSMAVDYENRDRSYLFGRLLAVEERVENAANRLSGIERETNAMRYQSAFVQHPFHTWAILEKQLNEAYYPKLGSGLSNYFKNIVSEITDKLDTKDYPKLNAPLNDNYLLGYYLQRMENNTKTNKTEE